MGNGSSGNGTAESTPLRKDPFMNVIELLASDHREVDELFRRVNLSEKADSIEELKSHRGDQQSNVVDEDENAAAESFELPGADLSREELSVHVVPQLDDEFTCSECFLVHHRSQLAYIDEATGLPVCTDCAG